MSKNGSKIISLKQYRLTDLFLFALIMIAGEVLAHVALVKLSTVYYGYIVTFTIPVTLIVMTRWGWPSAFYAAGDGLLYCLLNKAEPRIYIIYIIGNLFIMLLLLVRKLMGKNKITSKWYFTVLFVVLGWIAVVLGRSLVGLCVGVGFVSSLVYYCGVGDIGLLNLALAIIIAVVLRRFDGMWEDQKHYLLRVEAERKEKMRRDEFGDEPIEIDGETLSILNKKNDLYK